MLIGIQYFFLTLSLQTAQQAFDEHEMHFLFAPLEDPQGSKDSTSRRSLVDWSNYYPRKLHTRKAFSHDTSSRALSGRPPRMIHECTCLDNGSDEQHERPVAMLDIPGASLFIAHWNRGFRKLNLDFNISRGEFYDMDVKERYPIELYGLDFSTFTSSPLGDFESTAAIFPDPMERMVAAYDLEPENNTRKISASCRRWDLKCYATTPGVANCMTKIMLGQSRFEPMELTALKQNQSIQNLKDLAFVAVEEEWNEAVCQFHRIFGGVPLQGAFRPNGFRTEPVKILDELRTTYEADLDSELYEAAKREFHKRYLPEGDSQRCHHQEISRSLSFCWPTTCQQMSKQCGEWPDGCGGVLVCGQCLQGRFGLPNGWQVECTEEGQCIQTCPRWVENGIWFEDDLDLKDRLELAGAPSDLSANEFSQVHYMTPLDAVRICAKGCQKKSSKGKAMNFIDRFCICGEQPDRFLAQAPSAADYHNMAAFDNQKFSLFNVNFNGLLRKVHSQPKCCDKSVAMAGNNHWHRGTTEAEYFAAYNVGCGKHDVCAQLGRQHGADVVVFSQSMSLCHLGKLAQGKEKVLEGSTSRGSEKMYRMLNKEFKDFTFVQNIVKHEFADHRL